MRPRTSGCLGVFGGGGRLGCVCAVVLCAGLSNRSTNSSPDATMGNLWRTFGDSRDPAERSPSFYGSVLERRRPDPMGRAGNVSRKNGHGPTGARRQQSSTGVCKALLQGGENRVPALRESQGGWLGHARNWRTHCRSRCHTATGSERRRADGDNETGKENQEAESAKGERGSGSRTATEIY